MIAGIHDLRARGMRHAIILLWALVPLVAWMGLMLGTGGVAAAALVATVAGLVTLEHRRSGAGLSAQMAAAAALAVGVSTIVFLLRGYPWQADAHMIFFAAFALTAVFCDWRPIATYAAVIAVHHLGLNFTFTAAVFPGEASLGRVLLHAVVLVVQAVPLIWLASVLERMFAGADALVARAEAALDQAERLGAAQTESRAALQQVVDGVRAGLHDLAAGHLNRPLTMPFPAEYEALRADYNAALARLSATISEVIEAAHSIVARSTEISAASEELSRRSESQSAALEETAVALDVLTGSVRTAADRAREVEIIVQRAGHAAETNGAVVEAAVAAMSEIERSSRQISVIIGAIEDIAFQTNLLALNAGVEAARAGDAGRGFAVVASEVRALAKRSADAAKEIKALISTSAGHVERGVDEVGKAGAALHALVGSVSQISTLVSGLSAGSAEQAAGLAEINSGVTHLDQVTRENATMVDQATTANRVLQQDARALAAIVAVFDVRVGAAGLEFGPSVPAPVDFHSTAPAVASEVPGPPAVATKAVTARPMTLPETRRPKSADRPAMTTAPSPKTWAETADPSPLIAAKTAAGIWHDF